MEINIILIAIIVLLLIGISGFFSGTETAMTASSKARLVQLSKKGNKKAKKVLFLLSERDNLIGGLLLANNFVNILASSLATTLFLSLMGENGVFITTIVMTTLIVIFAEVLPKVYAMSNSDRMAMAVAPIINYIILILSPLNKGVIFIVNKILSQFNVNQNPHDSKTQEEELRGAIELHDGDDPDYKQEREMLRSVLDLDDTSIEEAITHRKNVVTIDINASQDKIIETFINHSFEKFPVTNGSENIVGVITQNNLIKQIYRYNKKKKPLNLKKIMEKAWFVPESTSMLDQLQVFRDKGNHFAIVVDEYGSYMGIITITDVFEHIVGDVHNQENQPNLRSLSDGSYLFDGNESIRNINRELDWNIDDEQSSTIAGYIIHRSENLPTEGQIYNFDDYEFIIAKIENQQISKIRVKK
jgi:Mg2+/Co2+ transporter CorB